METQNSISDQLRIASFAVYLKPGDDSFVKKLMESEAVGTSSKVVAKDGEIGVFGAERYFNMSLDSSNNNSQKQLEVVGGGRINKKENTNPPYYCNSKVMRRTASMKSSSESSWTTQSSTFLKTNKLSNNSSSSSRRGFFAGFSCYKSCNDTKSIYTVAPPRSSSRGTGSSILDQPQFSFPVMIEQNRPSLEVFGISKPPCNNNDIVAMNLERKLSVLTWDAIPTRTTAGLQEEEDEDMRSDGSSDLFEIETISAAGPCVYAPSEASIEWSVVTASAPDYSDYKLPDIHPFNLIPSHPPKSNFRQPPKVRGLLGCNNDKAVQVLQTNIATAASSPQLKRLVSFTNK